MLKQEKAESPTTFWFLAFVILDSGIGILITHHVTFIMLFLLYIALGLGSIETVNLLRQAIRAIDEGEISQTQAVISISKSSDDDQYS